jgi:hypothetical protein
VVISRGHVNLIEPMGDRVNLEATNLCVSPLKRIRVGKQVVKPKMEKEMKVVVLVYPDIFSY